MQKNDCQATGLYQEGNSLLHRLDPRLKLAVLLLLIISLFADPSPRRILVLFIIAFVGLLVCRLPFRQVFKKIMMLRWLLLFSLLLHLLFTPGRTLLGTSWLSYDGLMRGLTVDLQLMLALFFSYLMAMVTSPEQLAWGLTRLLAPLGRFGVPVTESGGLLLLVLHFVPIVRDEAILLYHKELTAGFMERVRSSVGLVGPLLLRLVDRADALAQEMLTGGYLVADGAAGRKGEITLLDRWVIIGLLPVLLLLWMI